MYMQLFSKRLKDLMELEGESNRSLSMKTNLDRKSIRCWLTGKFFPKYDALIKLATHFKVRVDYLIGLEEVLENEPYASDNATPIEEVPQRFLSLIKEYMEENHLTNYAMAKKLKMDQKAFTKWLKKGSMPETATLIKLVHATGISANTLLGRE